MNLSERPNLDAVKYLDSFTFEQFSDDCIRDAETKGEKIPLPKTIKQWHTTLKNFCKSHIKNKGVVTQIYHYSIHTPSGLGGRLFCSNSVQSIWNVYRGLLMRGIGTDIDMKNCHPVLLRYICKKHEIECPHLEYYINNRDYCLEKFESKEIGKTAYLVSVNTDKFTRRKDAPEQLKRFDREMKEIQNQLVRLPDYRGLFDAISDYQKSRNYNGSAINRILCYYENIALQHLIHFATTRGIEIAVLMFDGLMIYGNYYSDSNLLMDLEDYLESQMPGLNMKLAYKEHNNDIQIPLNYEIELQVNEFERMSREFEETHAKIIRKGYFISNENNTVTVMTKQHIQTAYEHLSYMTYDKDGNVKENNFIRSWLCNNPSMKTYLDVGCYPKDSMCPSDHFNTWTKFDMELVDEYEHREDALQFMLNHIRVLCNHEETVYDYFIKWIAQMIQYPEVKTNYPIFISREGCGKGSLIRLFGKMFGKKKILETTSPSEHVWGSFNSLMLDAFLVSLNEMSQKDTIEAEGKIKGLITDDTLLINRKGIQAFPITSYHRFIGSTNSEEPVLPKSDDRRVFIIRCSDELIDNKEYFYQFNEYLSDTNAVKTCYEYFKSIPGMDKFGSIPKPITEYHQSLTAMTKPVILRWIEDFAAEQREDEFVDFTAAQLMSEFDNWRRNNNIRYTMNSLQLTTRLGMLKLNGIDKIRTDTSRFTRFHIGPLRQSLGIGCLVLVTDNPQTGSDIH